MNKISSEKRYFTFQDKKEVLSVFGLISGVYFVVMLTAFRPLHEWVFTQWMFSYEIKFVKRGLPGEILRLMGLEVNYILIFAIGLSISLILNFALLFFFSAPLRKQVFGRLDALKQITPLNWVGKSVHIGLVLFFLMAILHSATLQRFFQFLGYLEHLQLILVLGGFFSLHRLFDNYNIDRFKKTDLKFRFYQYLIVGTVCVFSLFIHEGFLFFYLPMIFMYWFYKEPGNTSYNFLRLLLFAGLICLTWFIGTYGLLSGKHFEPLLAELVRQFGETRVDIESLRVIFRGFSPNLEFTRIWFEQRFTEKLIHLIFTILILSPTFYVIWQLYYEDFRQMFNLFRKKSISEFGNGIIEQISKPENPVLRTILLASCFTPLFLVPIGIDLFRWISISITNVFVITAVLMFEPDLRHRLAETLFKYRYMVGFVIALSLIFGVLGITNSFSWVYKLTTNLGMG